jgi:hypothetical protein
VQLGKGLQRTPHPPFLLDEGTDLLDGDRKFAGDLRETLALVDVPVLNLLFGNHGEDRKRKEI